MHQRLKLIALAPRGSFRCFLFVIKNKHYLMGSFGASDANAKVNIKNFFSIVEIKWEEENHAQSSDNQLLHMWACTHNDFCFGTAEWQHELWVIVRSDFQMFAIEKILFLLFWRISKVWELWNWVGSWHCDGSLLNECCDKVKVLKIWEIGRFLSQVWVFWIKCNL